MARTDAELETRMQDLESRLVFQDDTIDELNQVVRQQWELIDRLGKRLEVLEHRLAEVEDRLPPLPVAPPPHY